ncbi:MAG: hypothetical protein AAGI01_07150 [Myxococcota bacterium]
MSHGFEDIFGELRALINGPRTAWRWRRVCDVVERAYELDPERVLEQWMPYLRQATGRWPRRIKRAPSRWIDASEALLGIFDVLTLRGEPVGDDGAMSLARSEHVHSLTYLDLSGAGLTARGLSYLCESDALHSLQVLSIWDNPLGDEGAKVLAEAKLQRVERLYARDVGISDEGAIELAQSEAWPKLRTLNLEHNHIEDLGAEALASVKASTMPSLERLLLRRNLVSKPTREALLARDMDIVLKV